MHYQLIVACLVVGALADPFHAVSDGQSVWNHQHNQHSAGQQGAEGSQASGHGQGAGRTEAHMSQQGAQAARVEAEGANQEESIAGMRRRQSVLIAADHEEGAGFEGRRRTVGSAGSGGSSAVAGYCNGIPMAGGNHLCCDGQYYGDTWSELSCCGNSVYDGRFYQCKNNVMSPMYKPANVGQAPSGATRLCGNYVWQMYNAPYELCCEGVHYPNPYGHYGCCGSRSFDSRYYSCGKDEVTQRWYVFKRSTFVLAATEELEAVGARRQSGVGRIAAEEGAVVASHAGARESFGREGANQGSNYGQGAGAGQGSAGAGMAGQGHQQSAYGSPYGYGSYGGGYGFPQYGNYGYGKK